MAVDISVIILSYNTKDTTRRCLDELLHSLTVTAKSLTSEIIVLDNASEDTSDTMLIEWEQKVLSQNIKFIKTRILLEKVNHGFPKGNNKALRYANGNHILFLNSDVMTRAVNWHYLIGCMYAEPDRGAMTVQVVLPNGKTDMACHRGYPTIWNAICYFMKLESLSSYIPSLRPLFGGYHMLFAFDQSIHRVHVISGAFFLTQASVIKDVGGFDESYFMYGEDIDLCYRIAQKGKYVIYDPTYSVIHHKYQSGLANKDKKKQAKTRQYFYESMNIFIHKHYSGKYPSVVLTLMNWVVTFLKKYS